MELVAEILVSLMEEAVWSAIFSSTNKKSQDPGALAAEIRFSSVRSSEEQR
jgi:hypothetical protein